MLPYPGRSLSRRLLLLGAVALLVGCGATTRARDKLHLAGRDVLDALQFGDFQVVGAYLRPDLKTDFLARAYGVEKALKVTEFTPIGLNIAEDDSSARMVTRLGWYELPSTSVKTENIIIDWKRADTVWYIEQVVGGPLPIPDPGAAPPPPVEPAAAPGTPPAAPAAGSGAVAP